MVFIFQLVIRNSFQILVVPNFLGKWMARSTSSAQERVSKKRLKWAGLLSMDSTKEICMGRVWRLSRPLSMQDMFAL